jgi:hypothetical protein
MIGALRLLRVETDDIVVSGADDVVTMNARRK